MFYLMHLAIFYVMHLAMHYVMFLVMFYVMFLAMFYVMFLAMHYVMHLAMFYESRILTMFPRMIFFKRCFAMHSLPLRVRSCIRLSFLTSPLTRSCIFQLLIRSSPLAILALPPHWRMKGGWPAETNGRSAGMSRSLYVLYNL